MDTSAARNPSSSTKYGIALRNARLLSREEEVELATKYHETHDPALARQLVESHLRLVVKIARQCCSREGMLADVIQEGCLGLIRAVEKFDPTRGIRLSSYAAWWIRAFIYQYIMVNSRMMRVATTFQQRKLFFNLNRETQILEREGKEADPKALAARLNVTEKAVIEMRGRLGGREVQFETTVAVDVGTPQDQLDGMTAPPRPDELVEGQQFDATVRKRLEAVAETLDERDRYIFEQRLRAEKPITLRALGMRFNISRERARQLEARLKKRLQPVFRDLVSDGESEPSLSSALSA